MTLDTALQLQRPATASWRLVINFLILSIVLACLIGMGKHSSFLPLLVCISAAFAVVGCDLLGWIRINRTLSYVGMLTGTGIALYGYWNDPFSKSGVANLHAVANMLVYIQLPLMFQRRDPRVFEHWGVFLILEFVVAALLNDNVLFGLLLIPSLAVACSTLMALASYISYDSANKSGPELPWRWSQMFSGFFWERRRRSLSNGILMSFPATAKNAVPDRTISGWFGGLIFGMGIVLFSMVYFFVLPRLHTGAYEGLGVSKPIVGFSGHLTLEDVGELMQNDDLAFRMSMQEVATKIPFDPLEPPYVRGTIVDIYDGRGGWSTSNEALTYSDILLPNQVREELRPEGDTYIVTIQEQTKLGATQLSLPPFVRSGDSTRLKFNAKTWCLLDNVFLAKGIRTKRRYQFETLSYQLSRQIPYLISVEDSLPQLETESSERKTLTELTWTGGTNSARFPGLLALRDQILESAALASPMEKALLLEDYLASSGRFTYSLLPKVNRANGLDPIEDFAANHRTGNCQYFASTLAIMLRSMGLPSRIVIGFRPAEYNEVGHYFAVRQRHAHTWVEVHLDVDELQVGALDIPTSTIRHGLWLRLDPTPTGSGSNSGGSLTNASRSSQSFEAMEQLWKDNFMEYDSTRQPGVVGLFGASGDGTIGAVLRVVERLMLQLQSQTFGSTELAAENRFSWLGGLAASLIAIVGLAAYRLASRIPWKLGRNIARNSTKAQLRRTPSWALLRRMEKALARLGLHREAHQTMLEFVITSQNRLNKEHSVAPAATDGLRTIVDAFYVLRYGSGQELNHQDWDSLQATVSILEKFALEKRKLFR